MPTTHQAIPFPADNEPPSSPSKVLQEFQPAKTPLASKMVNSISSRVSSGRRDSNPAANEEIANLRDQLARTRADLSLARSQLARLDPASSSYGTSPSGRVRRPSTPSSISTRPLSPGASSQIPLPRRKGMRTLSAASDGSEIASIRIVSAHPPPSPSHPSPTSRAPGEGASRIPISAVSLGRVLAGDPSPPSNRRAGQPSTVLEEAADPVENGVDKPLPRRRPRLVSSRTATPDPSADALLPPSQIPVPVAPQPGSPSLSSVTSTASNPSGAVRSSRANPFFSSGGGRDRGAMIHAGGAGSGGNTSKVITSLQTDLLYARTALEQSKSQLRQNQRATESLTRQVDDLRESMSRSRLENEGLTKMVNRKERTVSELMDRVKKAEAELGTLKAERKEVETSCKRTVKESEDKVAEAEGRRDRAEAAYEAVKSGVAGLTDGWAREKASIMNEVEGLVAGMKKEGDELKLKYQTLAKLHASRSSALSSLTTTMDDLRASRDQFAARYGSELADLRAQLCAAREQEGAANEMAAEVEAECKRLKRMLRGGVDSPAKQ